MSHVGEQRDPHISVSHLITIALITLFNEDGSIFMTSLHNLLDHEMGFKARETKTSLKSRKKNETCSLSRFISCPHPLHVFFTSILLILTCMPSCQSPTRAFLLKMAVQRRAADAHPPRPGSACSIKRILAMEAELAEARPSSACFHHPALPNKLAEKVKRGSIVRLETWPPRPNARIDASVWMQERTYRSPEKRSSLPRPAKSLTRHIPAAEQEDNSTPSRPTCKTATTRHQQQFAASHACS